MKWIKFVSWAAVATLLVLGGGAGCKKRPGKTTILPDRGSVVGDEAPGKGSGTDVPPGPKTEIDSGKSIRPNDGNNGRPLPNNSVPPTVFTQPIDTTKLPGGSEQGITAATGDFSNWIADPSAFSADTVHFDFDKFTVRDRDKSKLEDVATQMRSLTGKAVRVEGHCDERGTEEYNRALGERRALAVREFLVSRGVDPKMIPTISYGEDMPIDPGHSEAAWSKNRRGELILLSPPK